MCGPSLRFCVFSAVPPPFLFLIVFGLLVVLVLVFVCVFGCVLLYVVLGVVFGVVDVYCDIVVCSLPLIPLLLQMPKLMSSVRSSCC